MMDATVHWVAIAAIADVLTEREREVLVLVGIRMPRSPRSST